MSTQIYVGITAGRRECFRAPSEPTTATHGDRYAAVIGPFRTRRAAELMARHGQNNPHLQTVADAEVMAKLIAKKDTK